MTPNPNETEPRNGRNGLLEATESRTEEYWDWVAVGLFLLVTVDLLTSLYAVEAVGVVHESNPVMRFLLSRSVVVAVVAHIGVVVLVSYFFYALFEVMSPSDGRGTRAILELYIAVFVAAGLFVFANNLAVVVLGGSLL